MSNNATTCYAKSDAEKSVVVPTKINRKLTMSKNKSSPPQLPPSEAIDMSRLGAFEHWFEYPIKVYPHHTDYAGVVWHGTYITWMEEARIECLRSMGIEYKDLVNLGCELPVVELSVRYHRTLEFGLKAVVKSRMEQVTGVRLNWDQVIVSPDGEIVYTTAKITLVAIDRDKGKIMRQLPANVRDALSKFSDES